MEVGWAWLIPLQCRIGHCTWSVKQNFIDHPIAREWGIVKYLRYRDDIVVVLTHEKHIDKFVDEFCERSACWTLVLDMVSYLHVPMLDLLIGPPFCSKDRVETIT